jgi:hypothetical protein
MLLALEVDPFRFAISSNDSGHDRGPVSPGSCAGAQKRNSLDFNSCNHYLFLISFVPLDLLSPRSNFLRHDLGQTDEGQV